MHKVCDSHYKSLTEGVEPLPFNVWHDQRQAESPHFQYWSLTLKFELTILIFVRSVREGNFQLHKEVCAALARWFFELNSSPYS